MDSNLVGVIIKLLTNISLGVVVVLLYSGAGTWTDRLSVRARHAALGLAFGLTTVLANLVPVQVAPGVIASSAAVSMALSGLFGGWLAGTVAGLIGVVSRVVIGGPGALGGSASVVLAVAVGIGVGELVRRTSHRIHWWHLLLQGGLIVCTAYSTFFLVPGDLKWELFRKVGLPVAIALPGGTLLLGSILLLELRRREISERLAESERRFRAMVANLPGTVYQMRLSKDGKIAYTYMSDRIRDALGVSGAEIVANPSLLERAFYPEDEAERRSILEASIATLSPSTRDFRMRLPDGTPRWIRSYSTPHREPNGDILFDGVTVDIEQSKLLEADLRRTNEKLAESERRFHAMVRNVPGAVFQVRRSPDGRTTYPFLSDGFEALYGIPAAQAQANPDLILRAYLPEEEDARLRSLQISQDTLSVRSRDYRIRHADGSIRWIHSRSVPHREDNGDVVWDGMMTGITAQKQAEEEARRSERLQAVGQLTDGVAHEFNNLLMILSGNTEVLAQHLAREPAAAESIQQIQRAVERGSRLTQELRAFAQKQMLRPEHGDIGAMLEAMNPLLNSALGTRIALEIRPGPALWPVRVDLHRLQTALLNLILNARDAVADEGSIIVATGNVLLGAEQARPIDMNPGRYVGIEVRDNGVGMTAEVLQRATDPFFTTKEVGQGSGLGLSMVHGFVKQSGGHLAIASTPGQGTVVSLLLPAALD